MNCKIIYKKEHGTKKGQEKPIKARSSKDRMKRHLE